MVGGLDPPRGTAVLGGAEATTNLGGEGEGAELRSRAERDDSVSSILYMGPGPC